MMPMRGILTDCCARAASGHAAAAPPSAASNCRRPIVTFIRPSRARCVKGRISRREPAVWTGRHPRRAERTPGTGCCNGPTPALRLRFDSQGELFRLRFLAQRSSYVALGALGGVDRLEAPKLGFGLRKLGAQLSHRGLPLL